MEASDDELMGDGESVGSADDERMGDGESVDSEHSAVRGEVAFHSFEKLVLSELWKATGQRGKQQKRTNTIGDTLHEDPYARVL